MRLKTKIAGVIMALSIVGLTSCNKDVFDTQYTFNKAIISLNGQIKVYDIVSWTDYADGEQFQLELTDGSIIVSSSYNTILIYTSGGESQVVKDFCYNDNDKK